MITQGHQIICQYLGGSWLYGLNTPTSDEDIRYVFLNTELRHIIGIDKFEHIDHRTKEEDSFGMELRGLFSLLRKTNTQVIELLYAPTHAFTKLDANFQSLVLNHRNRFIDSDRFYSSLLGYIFTERRLALGERKGAIGGKRYEAVEKYGYSPKNMVQLFRLGYAGIEFFQSGVFPTNIKDYNTDLHQRLLDIKTHPENYNPNELVKDTFILEEKLKSVYNSSTIKLSFDNEYANWVAYQFYFPILKNFSL